MAETKYGGVTRTRLARQAPGFRAHDGSVTIGRILRHTMEMVRKPLGDLELLTATRSGQASAFGLFFERYHPVVLAYLLRRTTDRETAADLAAEVFARALLAVHRGMGATEEPAVRWLLGIARNAVIDSVRRGRVEADARRALGMEPVVLTDDDIERLGDLTDDLPSVLELMETLPVAQRDALKARIVDERDYDEIAADLECSDFVIRQRVSRALRSLRTRLEAEQ